MLAAAQRLRRSSDFTAVFRGGRRSGRGTLVVHLFLEEPAQASTARAGFVVSKAVGNAVVRNRVRRRLRHLVRPLLASLPAGAPSLDAMGVRKYLLGPGDGRLVVAGYHQDGPRQVNMWLWNWRGIDVINAHERDPAAYIEGMRQAVAAVQAGDMNPFPLFTHSYPISELATALNETRDRPDGFMKALIRY